MLSIQPFTLFVQPFIHPLIPSLLCFCFTSIHLSVLQTKRHEPSSYQTWGSERTRSGPALRRAALPGQVSKTGEGTGAPSLTGLRIFRVGAPSWLEWEEASRRVGKVREVDLRAESHMQPSSCQTSMTNPIPQACDPSLRPPYSSPCPWPP